MTRIVLLDSGPLGLVTNPVGSPEAVACNEWLASLLENGTRVLVPVARFAAASRWQDIAV